MHNQKVSLKSSNYKSVMLQICIRWGIQHGTSVIPKATSDDHVVGNLDVLDWQLSSEDYEVTLQACFHTSDTVASVITCCKNN